MCTRVVLVRASPAPRTSAPLLHLPGVLCSQQASLLLTPQPICTTASPSADLGCPCPPWHTARGASPTGWPPGRAPRRVCAGVGDSEHRLHMGGAAGTGPRTARRLQAVRIVRPSRAGAPGGQGRQALSQHVGPSRLPGREVNTREAPGGRWTTTPSRAPQVTRE